MPLRIDQLEAVLVACGLASKRVSPRELLIVSARSNADARVRVNRTVLLRRVNARLQVRCRRCGKRWTPLVKKPRQCPRCKTPYWDRRRMTEPQKVAARVEGARKARADRKPRKARKRRGRGK